MGLAGGPRRTAPPPGSSTDSFKKQAKRKEVLRGGVRASAHLLPRGGGVGGDAPSGSARVRFSLLCSGSPPIYPRPVSGCLASSPVFP